MYQPYPTSGQPLQSPQQAEPPRSVINAVRLMYVGAGLSALSLIIGLVTIGSLKSDIKSTFPHYTTTQVHTAEVAETAVIVISGLIGIGLWLWMAWANRRGRNWARIVSAVLFGIDTLSLIASLREAHAVASLAFSVVLWLVGLGAIILIFNRESTPFYKRPR